MEKLTLEHIAPYLPYRLKVQYEGITNGKEIKDYDCEFKRECENDLFYDTREDYKPPQKVIGSKIGFIKKVCTYLHHVTYHIGIKGLQTHYSTEKFKPILRPMDLTKPIIVDGKEIIPILELANIYQKQDWELTHEGFAINEDLSEEFGIRHGCFSVMDNTYDLLSLNQLPLFQWLFKHKFDVFNLIPQNLAIDVNTLTTNPYN